MLIGVSQNKKVNLIASIGLGLVFFALIVAATLYAGYSSLLK